MRKLFAAAVLTLVAYSQVPQSGPQVFTYLSDIDDTDQPYSLYLPGGYDNTKKWPLVISLHGEGSNHRLNLRRLFGRGNRLGETDAEASRYFPAVKDVDFIVASPFARGTMGYQGIAERDVYAVLEQVRDKFNIDEDRIYLTGLSMGGGGALWLGLTRPDIWAAIAPVCPYHPPAETADLAGNALNVPVKMFQGALDPLVRAGTVRLWQKRFLDARVRSEYVEYPTVRHNAWDTAYRDGTIFDWFKQFRRVRYPNRVQFAARDYAHASAYWVRFDALTPGTLAHIDANFTAKNAVTITTAGLDGFTLQLKGHPMAVRAGRLAVTIDDAKLRPRVADTVSFVKTAKGWSAVRPEQPAGNKRAGAEGPLAHAVASRHVYVYGTADGAPAEEIARRLAVANRRLTGPRRGGD